ncbi:uncharacterized protein [Melopsittacus undulatus]|uniref:uncharacterized protein n=1 Tax=Melopsittacus undulatus TaxID=13146 RepID=UPI00146F83D6|nr:uncharacterized protein LOC101877838 [Melopsittacus undulatus]
MLFIGVLVSFWEKVSVLNPARIAVWRYFSRGLRGWWDGNAEEGSSSTAHCPHPSNRLRSTATKPGVTPVPAASLRRVGAAHLPAAGAPQGPTACQLPSTILCSGLFPRTRVWESAKITTKRESPIRIWCAAKKLPVEKALNKTDHCCFPVLRGNCVPCNQTAIHLQLQTTEWSLWTTSLESLCFKPLNDSTFVPSDDTTNLGMKNFLELIENGIAELRLNWRKYIS